MINIKIIIKNIIIDGIIIINCNVITLNQAYAYWIYTVNHAILSVQNISPCSKKTYFLKYYRISMRDSLHYNSFNK